MANLVFAGNVQSQVKRQAENLAATLLANAGPVEILGPSPCPLSRLRGKSRYQLLLKAADRAALRTLLNVVEGQQKNVSSGVGLVIDIDPIDMF